MATEKELEVLLRKLVEAAHDARAATQEAHVARRDLLVAVKNAQRDIRQQIEAEVKHQVGEIQTDVSNRMRDGANDILVQLDKDWRARLGLAV